MRYLKLSAGGLTGFMRKLIPTCEQRLAAWLGKNFCKIASTSAINRRNYQRLRNFRRIGASFLTKPLSICRRVFYSGKATPQQLQSCFGSGCSRHRGFGLAVCGKTWQELLLLVCTGSLSKTGNTMDEQVHDACCVKGWSLRDIYWRVQMV